MNNWLNIIQNKCLPPRCILCDAPGLPPLDLCPGCYRDLPRNQPCCPQCAIGLTDDNQVLCGHCLQHPPGFDQAIVPFRYQEAIPYLVTRLKYHHHYAHARLLALLMLQAISRQASDRPECLLAVPLHPKRYRERGFNQAQEIALHLSRHLQIPIASRLCERVRATPHQTGLNARARQQNLRSAFAVTRAVPFRHLAIIDDVITTGSTASILAQTLKQQGAERISLWAFARA